LPDRKADTPYYIALCERMRMARVHGNVTQEAVAHTLGTQMQRISKMERGDVRPRADVVAAYARMFHIDITWLLTGDEGPMEVLDPPGRNKYLPKKMTPPGPVVQREERRIRAKIKKAPPPAPRPVDPAKLWRPDAWKGEPDRRTIGLTPGGADVEMSSSQRGA
jgi:transcriptional regulator with XRE-family HTH domain